MGVVLKEVDLNVVDNDQCQTALRGSRLGQKFKLDPSFMCAGGEGKDTCKGDGGSPLVCRSSYDPDTYEQVGIVAWGIGCGEYPGVYASVSEAVCWIDYAMTCYYGENKNDFNSYWSNDYGTCGVWFENKLNNLPHESLRNACASCNVNWVGGPPTSPFKDGKNPDPAPPKETYPDPAPPADNTGY